MRYDEAAQTLSMHQSAMGTPNRQRQPARVLVVDDDPVIRAVITSKMRSMTLPDLEIVEACDGQEAWRELSSGKFHLVFVDLEMPNIDGITLIRCIRGHPLTKHLPAVVLTSRDGLASIHSALAAGATSYLTKPIAWTTFKTHVAHILKLSIAGQQSDEMSA